ncbi:MAG: sensor histidine kinase [Treponema sp.]|jgi:sensor histidine kinase YesM|nr:sensor histidine kinase [Treponema sp.]
MGIKSLYRKSVVFKLRTTNSAIILLFFIIVAVLVSMVYHSIIVMREKQTMEVYLKNTLNSVDNKIMDMSRVSLVAFSDDIALDILQHGDSYTLIQKVRSQEYLKSLYTKLISIRNDIRGVYLFDEEKLVFYQNTTEHVIKTNYPMGEFIEGLRRIEAVPVYGRANHRMVFTTQPGFLLPGKVIDPFIDPFENYCIGIVREIRTFSPNRRIGHILLITPVSALKETLTEFSGAHFSFLLVDKDGTVMFSEAAPDLGWNPIENEGEIYSPLAEGQTLSAGIFNGHYKGEKSIIAWRNSSYSGVTLLTAAPRKYLYHNTLFFSGILAVIFAAATAIVLILTGKFTRNIVNPIHYLSEAMIGFSRENITDELPVDSEDEVGQLTASFNTMKKTINDLIFTEYENKIKFRTLQLQQKEAQLKNLQGQINPHFLYNTLDNIRIKAALNGDRETAEMIMLLVDFFRENMGTSTHMVPVSKEIHLIRIYLALMQYRYPNLQVEFSIDEEIDEIEMPSFILQPIVENSLLHGLKSVNYNGKILISLSRDPEKPELVLIKISDNGTGFNEESRRQAEKPLKNSEAGPGRSHIGIANVRERLRLYYSDDCGLFFEKKPGGGVTAVIKIRERADNPGFQGAVGSLLIKG